MIDNDKFINLASNFLTYESMAENLNEIDPKETWTGKKVKDKIYSLKRKGEKVSPLIFKPKTFKVKILGEKRAITHGYYHQAIIKSGHILMETIKKNIPISDDTKIFINEKIGQTEYDVIIFKKISNELFIIEIKADGELDTKKIRGEREKLFNKKQYEKLYTKFGKDIIIKPLFCSFFSTTIGEIRKNTKNKIETEFLITGKELCSLLYIEFDNISNEISKNEEEILEFEKKLNETIF